MKRFADSGVQLVYGMLIEHIRILSLASFGNFVEVAWKILVIVSFLGFEFCRGLCDA